MVQCYTQLSNWIDLNREFDAISALSYQLLFLTDSFLGSQPVRRVRGCAQGVLHDVQAL